MVRSSREGDSSGEAAEVVPRPSDHPLRHAVDCLSGVLRRVAIVAILAASAAPLAYAQAPDTSTAIAAARRAQRRFELVRRAALPVVDGRGEQRCDVTDGTFCYWYDSTSRPPDQREPRRVTAARRTLLAVLDSLAARAPDAGEIVAQRVRYRLDAGDTTEAIRIAESECAAARWWCGMLAGFARHAASDFHGAEAAFDDALAAMDPAARCRWEDLSPLLPSEARSRHEARSCAEREVAARQIWWLATPLLSADANDFRTEFLARRTAAALEAHVAPLNVARSRRGSGEISLRYGRPEWWTRERPSPALGATTPHIVSHERVPGFAFIPDARILDDTTTRPVAGDWQAAEAMPSSRYAPVYARSWREIPAQVARFVRGDSLLLVASFDVTGDRAMTAPVASLAVSGGPGARTGRSRRVMAGRGMLTVAVARRDLHGVGLASLEIVDTAARAVARHRIGIAALPDIPLTVSDLLLFTPAPSAERARAMPSLDDVAARALTDLRVHTPALGVYWEAYGTSIRGPVTMTLTVERTGRSWLTRAAVRAGVVSRDRPLEIRWKDTPPAPGVPATRSVIVNLAHLTNGEYRIRLDVHGDGRSATSERTVILDRRP
jgi:hypothetical protein